MLSIYSCLNNHTQNPVSSDYMKKKVFRLKIHYSKKKKIVATKPLDITKHKPAYGYDVADQHPAPGVP